ncbi:DNA mismatch repair MutS family DNA-binding domain protein (macronuclear) [Tetrahymena thermophila SB210]|uniref:DNA mismatch repair protein n=2 Tax=Tetrahymena thermophila TaxID=5911 RepID=I7MGE9_TETTS|nr:DNA mismatch repair MutS family DNA-binding domain protein [Tetrahymena thermophila SB210]ADQ26783.1 putative mismatch repair protein [Tetrahymena thermophila]EAS01389.2 DNA mismatch repair MutS family DNA-binding domain protein [Tetrahymena thermophila SB210]|eukprot:XP_001021635.2 DNA mismatch repair MutS family DNA-binding domain protein [Tetrahymena thermophila SB210]
MPPKKTKSSEVKESRSSSKKNVIDSEDSEDQAIKKTPNTKKGSNAANAKSVLSKESSVQKSNSSDNKRALKKIQLSESEGEDKELFPTAPAKKKSAPAPKEIIVKEEESSEDDQVVKIKNNKNGSAAAATTTNKVAKNKKKISDNESCDEEEEQMTKNKKATNQAKNKKTDKENETKQTTQRSSRNQKKISYKEEDEEDEYTPEQEDEDFKDEEVDEVEEDEEEGDELNSDDDFEEQGKKNKKNGQRKNNKKANGRSEGANNEKAAKKIHKAPENADDNHIIDVQKEQGKLDIEDQYELPYFLTKKYLKDAEGRPVDDPEYDPSTLFIPIQELKKETPLFQQYWKIKVKHFDKVVFFRFGRNFVCFYTDAILMKKLFDCYIGVWGKRPVANIFDNHYRFYVKELLEKADKSCLVVDQVQFSDDRSNEQYLIKREVTQIITKGTYTDYVDNVEDYNARYLMCIVESETDHSFGLVLIDCTTHQIYLDDIKNDPAGNQIRTILRKMKPVEIHSVFNNLSEQTKNICKTTCKPQFTFDKSFEFYELQSIFEELKNEFREKIPINNPDSMKKSNQMEIEKPKANKKNNKKNNKKKQSDDDEDGSDESSDEEKSKSLVDEEDDDGSDSEDDIENLYKPEVKKEPKFTYGELSSDYPLLLKDIEEMYNIDKKKFEEELQKKANRKQKNSQDMQNEEDDDEPCFDIEYQYYMMLQALMLGLSYLRKLKLNDNVFRLGSFSLLDSTVQKNTFLHLDAHAIENLDIFEVNLQNRVTSEGSLMSFIDYTKTQFGKRMLKRWLSYPLKSIQQIEQRQEAIEDLMKIEDVIEQFDKKLSKLGDVERQISKIFNSSQKSRLKPTSFENFSNVRLKDAYSLVEDLKNLEEILLIFKDYQDNFNSTKLKKLVTVKDPEQINKILESTRQKNNSQTYLSQKLLNRQSSTNSKSKQQIIVGIFPDLKPFVELIQSQLEQDEQGYCQPKQGADAVYDEIVFKMKKIYKKMNNEALVWRKKFNNNQDIKLIKSKMQWEIQIPEKLVEGSKKPKELYLTSKVKGYQRFQTDKIISLCAKLKKVEVQLQKALSPFCERFFHLFYQNRELLYQAVNCIGELDCLCSLAKCSLNLKIRCKPTFIPESLNKNVFELIEMYHPQLLKENKKNLVPNDTIFEDNVTCMLVTGPNMGGKSTLLRQNCLAVILAQLGCFLPAKSFKTIIRDRIFCRIGASDRLLEGKSTFLVEMEETGDIVKEATNQSLVLLDELGRGTSTFDGVSIAYGVLRYLVENVKCLTLFSTHYHMLVDEFKLYKNVQSYVMDFDYCSQQKKIDFKYKYIKGSSEKSFGVNVAKMAGLPDSVIDKAHKMEHYMNSEDQNIGNVRRITQKFNSIIEAQHQSDDTLLQLLKNSF